MEIIHRGRYKTMSEHHKRLLKRRQAIEPAIGHTKADHRMQRCWLQGATGDALHALCCGLTNVETPPDVAVLCVDFEKHSDGCALSAGE